MFKLPYVLAETERTFSVERLCEASSSPGPPREDRSRIPGSASKRGNSEEPGNMGEWAAGNSPSCYLTAGSARSHAWRVCSRALTARSQDA